jgi:hypothetical protein
VPYDLPRLFGYIALGLGLYGASRWLTANLGWSPWLAGSALMAVFFLVVYVLDGRHLVAARSPASAG